MTPDEYGVCIDCGRRMLLRLPSRFPHVCADCLFPVDYEAEQEQRDAVGKFVPRVSLVAQLHERVLAIGRIGPPGSRRMDG